MNAAVTTDFQTLARTSKVAPYQAAAHTPLTRLHPGVIGIAAGSYVLMIATFWVGFFATDAAFTISLSIVTIVLAAFIGLPLAMARTGAKFWRSHGQAEPPHGTMREFLNCSFDTCDGHVSGLGALALVTTVPLSLTAGVIAMAVIRHIV